MKKLRKRLSRKFLEDENISRFGNLWLNEVLKSINTPEFGI